MLPIVEGALGAWWAFVIYLRMAAPGDGWSGSRGCACASLGSAQ